MNADFTISFNRFRGLTYQDELGTLFFSFDFAMPDGKKITIYKTKLTGDLKPISSELSENDRLRMQLAFERVKQFVISKGYKIDDSDSK